ncbi:MAG: helix-turn-helix domain-containing protein [Methanobacteriaceae archaeon]|nr:helix-turn-helix domain-containing protein [Methanobacteriaceae archaeon]MDP3624588.1 helix-turn-helix domain-containing protein [Methanobacteriaceae archaeon]
MSLEKVHINQPLTSRKIMEVLEKYPDLKKITCPISLYKRTSPKYLDALKELGIEVEPLSSRGRPNKYDEKKVFEIKSLLKDGKTPKEISKQMKIPLKSVYYLNKDSHLKKGRKSKYAKGIHIKVLEMAKNGVPRKQISERLHIPLRTVYYILKK